MLGARCSDSAKLESCRAEKAALTLNSVAQQEEVLFQFEPSEDDEVQFHPSAPIVVENLPSVVATNVVYMCCQTMECLHANGIIHSFNEVVYCSWPYAKETFLCSFIDI